MKIFGQDTGKGRNHDYDPAEERRQMTGGTCCVCGRTIADPDNPMTGGTCCVCGRTIADPDNPKGGDCPRCGRVVKEK